MSRIWNANISESLNTKRFSNTINLKVGQRIYGRVINKGENQEAIIKLLNGAELSADIEGVMQDLQEMLLNFKVEGFKNGKLQLKIIHEENKQSKSPQADLLSFIMKEGLSNEDLPTLEGMLKYNIPLTKENITEVKSLVQFIERLEKNPEEAQNFVDKYLNSKNIAPDSPRGQMVTEKLTQFFSNLKDLSLDNLLLFLENEVDFSSENITSYNKLFKGDESIQDIIKNMSGELAGKEEVKHLEALNPKAIEKFSAEFEAEVKPKDIDGFIKDKESITKELVSIFRENKIALNSKSMNIVFNIINKLPAENITKEMLESRLTDLLDAKITIPQEKLDNLCELLGVPSKARSVTKEDAINAAIRNLIGDTEEVVKAEVDIKNENNNIDKKVANVDANLKEIVKLKESEAKEIIKNLLTQLASDSEENSAIMQSIKSNINDIKLFNKFSNEYYYLNVPINLSEKEYPCKLVIKDNRKEGKQIDSKNVKIALSIKTYNFGMINSFVKVNNNYMDVDINCQSNFLKIFEISKDKLKEKIDSLGYISNIKVHEIKEDFSLESCRDFFGDNNVAGIDVKV